MSANRLAVVGAGNMGSGIAQKIAMEGLDVTLVDIDEECVARGLAAIDRTLAEAVRRGVMNPAKAAAARARVHGTARLEDAAAADLVIEAVFEELALKQDVFRRLDAVCRPETILATNTSSFLVSEIAAVVKRPSRVIGLHYFYHPAKNHLVEVVAGAGTDRAIYRRAWALQEQIRKIPIASRDAYGFIVNRFFVVWMMEAVRMLEDGIANEATIDASAKEAFGIGMGPFELMNVTGIPIAVHASTTISGGYGPMYGPPARLREQLDVGALWPLDGAIDAGAREAVTERLSAMTFLVAATLVEEGVGTREDTDIGARVGLRWPAGPFELMNRLGTAKVLALVSTPASKWSVPVPRALAEAARTNSPFPLALVRSNTQDGIATITVDRPDAMNALNEAVVAQLGDAFRKAAGDPRVKGIVISGAGRSFVAGADIRFFTRNIEAGDLGRIARFTEQGQQLFSEIDDCAKPVVARLHGVALGGGVELALACDYIVATPGTTLGFPETGIGIYPGLGGTQRTTRRVGVGLAKWLVLTGKILGAEEAREIGLVDAVVVPEYLDAVIAELVEKGPVRDRQPKQPPQTHQGLATFFTGNALEKIRLGEAITTEGEDRQLAAMTVVGTKAPVALRIASELIDQGAQVTLEEGLRLELAHLEEIFSTKDALTGLSSIGKGRPIFEGR
jgi:enoyl-CoA hydratase/3-hydroxyacyl-CoA dehydrogenase